jgi:hypothetical protein
LLRYRPWLLFALRGPRIAQVRIAGAYEQRLDLILNGKGGVGKSFFAVNFVQFLKDKGIPHVAIDSDNENSTLKRFHPDAQFLDLAHPKEIDGIFAELDQTKFTVVDCRAASTDLFLDYFAEIDLAAVLSTLGVSLTPVMPANHELDSVDQVQRLADQLGKKCGVTSATRHTAKASRCLADRSVCPSEGELAGLELIIHACRIGS